MRQKGIGTREEKKTLCRKIKKGIRRAGHLTGLDRLARTPLEIEAQLVIETAQRTRRSLQQWRHELENDIKYAAKWVRAPAHAPVTWADQEAQPVEAGHPRSEGDRQEVPEKMTCHSKIVDALRQYWHREVWSRPQADIPRLVEEIQKSSIHPNLLP